MFKAVLLPDAKKDIQEAARWYNQQKSGLGKRFTAELREKVQAVWFQNYTPRSPNDHQQLFG